VDWSLLGCARHGHVTFAPEEPDLRDRLRSPAAAGESWRCLRCGAFVPGEPLHSGPVSEAPRVRRGVELRSVLILRIFAVERIVRGLVVAAAAYAVWRFEVHRLSIQEAFNHELPLLRPLFRQLGYDLDHSKLVSMIKTAFTLNSNVLGWFAIGLAAYALVEFIEAAGLWLARRWGEYFAMVATSAFLPIEVYELVHKVTVLRAGAFIVNLALVVYLVVTKRLFGARGGVKAYEARLRSEAIIDTEMAALAALAAKRNQPAGAAGVTGAAAVEAAAAPGLTDSTSTSAAE
jgi:uncharacterized membrane protein (DUF2068 family)